MVKRSTKLGLLAYANNSGLGIQSKRLAKLLKPYRTLIVDSRIFSSNKELHREWFEGSQVFTTAQGFPNNEEVDSFLQGLTHVLTLENPYNFHIIYRARQLGIKTICQVNYEFSENVEKPYLPEPDIFLMPSYWKIKEMKERFPDVRYLPPPIDPREFAEVRRINYARKGKRRFLHIMGTLAYKDRNGTLDLIKAIKLSKSDFELVIRTQHQIPMEYFLEDDRVKYEIGSDGDEKSLYQDFDALILPRRYGGLSLTTCESLMAGMPVIMTDISPNSELLPKEWLVKSHYKTQIVVKAVIDVHSVDHQALADKIDELCKFSQSRMDRLKEDAIDLAVKEFSPKSLKQKYDELFTQPS